VAAAPAGKVPLGLEGALWPGELPVVSSPPPPEKKFDTRSRADLFGGPGVGGGIGLVALKKSPFEPGWIKSLAPPDPPMDPFEPDKFKGWAPTEPSKGVGFGAGLIVSDFFRMAGCGDLVTFFLGAHNPTESRTMRPIMANRANFTWYAIFLRAFSKAYSETTGKSTKLTQR
jgi:hypothetical protein